MTAKKRENCILHCRVSTAKQAQEGDSLEAQELIGRGVASRKNWHVLQVFLEPYSGRKSERPLIEEIVSFIKASTEPVHHYIFKGIDRMTRAGVVEYIQLKERIEALGVNVVDSYGLIQPKQNTLGHLGFQYDWSVYSPSETAEILEAHRGKQEVRDILTRMIGAEIKLTQDGYKVRQPADGFLNKRVDVDGKKRVIEVPDPDRAHYFVEMFRLRAEGRLSDKDIVKRINAMGYRTKTFRRWNRSKDRIIGHTKPKPLTVKRFQLLVKRPIYCGVRVEKWTDGKPIKTRYPGLVSIETFNSANRGKVQIQEHGDGTLSISHGGPRKRVALRSNPLYPYKNVILCPECKKPFLGSASRGRLGTRYPAYHCHRGHYIRIPKAKFEETVDQYLQTLAICDVDPQELEEVILKAWESRKAELEEVQRKVEENVSALKAAQEAAVDSLVATQSPVARKKLEERINELEAQIQEAEGGAGLPDEAISRSDIDDFTAWVKTLMEHPLEVLKNPSNIEAQRGFFTIVFEKLPTYEQIEDGTPKLSPLFGLDWLFDDAESLSVRPARLGWKQLEPTIQRWVELVKSG